MRCGSRFARVCGLVASIAVVSCGSDKDVKPIDAGASDAPSQPIVGGKLGAALASAAAAAGTSGPAKGAPKGDDAPPENGIFAAAEADRRHPKDAPPKIDVISEGADPKVQLTPKLDAAEQKVTVNVGLRLNQNRLPPLDFALSIKPDKPTADKPKEGAAAPGPVRLAATVQGATVPASTPVPKEFTDTLAKLKGTVVRYDLTPTGVASNFAVEAPKEAVEGLEVVFDALIDAISMFTVPVPPKPVGKDGFWIAGDRAKTAAGVEVVRYRVFKVTSVDEGGVTLSVDIRQYAATDKLKLDTAPGQKSEMPMDAFESQGKGNAVWKADAFLPVRGDFSERLGARLAAPQGAQQQGQRAPVVQTELTATLGGAAPAAPEKKP